MSDADHAVVLAIAASSGVLLAALALLRVLERRALRA
jgi:hypothetical protein